MLSLALFTVLSLSLSSVLAQGGQTCNATSLCPVTRAPCCSEHGFCGTDYFCLGGCNPFASKSVDSCKPSPICKDARYTFPDNSRILSNSTLFDGNATAYDWVVEQGSILNTNSSGGELVLTLTKDGGGTKISSTRYVHFGEITATMKAGRWGGVVVAFITMSDIKDEIDWEFPGTDTTEGQSNYFWQGFIPPKSHGGYHKGLSDRSTNYHDYTINWQEESLTFLIDGKPVRTVNKADTINPTTGVAEYPTTPSRIQFSIWPAGISGYPEGTVEWAGGMINWDAPDYKSAGHFHTMIKQVTVKCANQPPANQNITSYKYTTDANKSKPSVTFSNQTTLLNGGMSAIALSRPFIIVAGIMTLIIPALLLI